MSATQELIAAALTECDLMTGMLGYEPASLRDLREACARAMVQPDMAEVERLAEKFGSLKWSAGCSSGHFDSGAEMMAETEAYEVRTALLDYLRGILAERDALIADNERLMQIAAQESDVGARVLREVFALCEDTQDKCSDEPGDFARGRRFEAKGIARAIGAWYQEEFCGRSHMGEPAAPAPDHFRDAAKMAPVHCTPTEHDGRIVYEHTSEPIPNADGFVLYAAPAPDRFRAAAKMMAVQPACMTCSGHGMVGGLLPNGGGYQADPCPDCAAPVTAEVPMPEENILKIRALDSAEVRWIGREALRTYGDAREAAGYAAGVAAGDEARADQSRLVRELDVLLNGEAGAARQASLCDIVAQVAALRGEVKP